MFPFYQAHPAPSYLLPQFLETTDLSSIKKKNLSLQQLDSWNQTVCKLWISFFHSVIWWDIQIVGISSFPLFSTEQCDSVIVV